MIQLNPVLWFIGTIALLYNLLILIIFVLGYAIVFDPRATRAGQLIFRFSLSVIGLLLSLIMVVVLRPYSFDFFLQGGLHGNGWWPIVRLVIQLYVSYTITSLVLLLIKKRWPTKKIIRKLPTDTTGSIDVVQKK